MVFIETPIFTEDVQDLLSDLEYSTLQIHLAAYPNSGDVIRGCGGLRKLRWAAMGRENVVACASFTTTSPQLGRFGCF
jgi:hypothetical protein